MSQVHTSVQLLRPATEAAHEHRAGRAGLRAHTSGAARAEGQRSMPEMLDQALEVLREHFALMAGLSALCWLPVRALQPFIGAQAWQNSTSYDLAMFGSGLGTLASTAGAVLAQTLAAALLAQLVMAHLEGREAGVAESLRKLLARLPTVVALAVLASIVTTAGTCACFVPGILLAWKLSCAPTACVIEGCSVGDSLRRSFLLTRRGLWRWAALALSVYAMMLPFTGITTLADMPLVRADVLRWCGLSSGAYDLLLVLLSSLLLGVATALQAAGMTVFYADCRVRREGVDLERSLEEVLRAAPAKERGP